MSEYDPTYVLRRASAYFRFDGTLRAADPPGFALNDRADMVITGEEIAILKSAAFDHLLSDVRALLNDVPKYAGDLKGAMKSLPMTPQTLESLQSVCATRPSYARQLYNLGVGEAVSSLTPAILRQVLKRHGEKPSDFIVSNQLDLTPDRVGTFSDLAEGRWYEADFTKEPRRAARWSKRS